jgi:hypothetical protein
MDAIRKEAAKLERLLSRREAAEYIKTVHNIPCSWRTLAKLACVSSDGPPFRRAGRWPLYSASDLDAWALSQLGPLMRSTRAA